MIFREILRRSVVFVLVLSSFERFPRNLRCSLAFWTCCYVFWSVLRLSCGFAAVLKGYWMFWGVLCCFLMFYFVLWRFEEFSLVLSCSERFLSVLRHSPMLLVDLFWKVPWGLIHSLTFFWCSEAFWGILMGYKRFWKTPGHSEASSYVVGWSEAFLSVLKGSLRFWGVIWLSEGFRFVLKRSHRFRVILKDSCTLCVILWSYGDIVRYSEAFHGFWKVQKCMWMFW